MYAIELAVSAFNKHLSNGPHTITYSFQLAHSSPLLSPVTIPKVVDVNENVFSVNLPGKIMVK
jgi:hypothetical protein